MITYHIDNVGVPSYQTESGVIVFWCLGGLYFHYRQPDWVIDLHEDDYVDSMEFTPEEILSLVPVFQYVGKHYVLPTPEQLGWKEGEYLFVKQERTDLDEQEREDED